MIKNGKILFNQIGNNREIRKKQALVLQTPILLRRNVRANLDFVSHVQTKDIRRVIENILKRVGLDGYEEKQERLLSGGEKQILSLDIAL